MPVCAPGTDPEDLRGWLGPVHSYQRSGHDDRVTLVAAWLVLVAVVGGAYGIWYFW